MAETKFDDTRKSLDASFEADLQYWLSHGFDWRDAELACLVNRLPMGGIPTKYMDLRRRCLQVDNQESEYRI